jgi:hypothetical protein
MGAFSAIYIAMGIITYFSFWQLWWQGGEARNVDCKESDVVITMPRYNNNKKKHRSRNQILTSSSRNCSRAVIIKIQSKNTNYRKEKSNNYKPKTTNRLKQRKGLNKHQAEPTIYHNKTN